MQLNSDALNKTITFDSYEGPRYKNLRFVSILDAQTVIALGFDAAAKHMQHYPYLPPGVPDSYTGYSYAKFLDANNSVIYMGIPWVKPSSITENANPVRQITLRDTDDATVASLRSMMIAHGIENFTIETL
jgi:hypothetical protein